MSDNRQTSKSMLTVLILLGMLFLYIAQMSPSTVLTLIEEDYGISPTMSGFSISVIFIPIVIFGLVGAPIQDRIGLKKTFILALAFGGGGVLVNLVAGSFAIFVIGRILYGIGFGLSTPFIGAAIMHWYQDRQLVAMDTANALFPYVGNIMLYGLTIPFVGIFGNSWKAALSLWGVLCIIILFIWAFGVKDEGPFKSSEAAASEEKEKGVYSNVLKRKEIIILFIAFVCDFISFSVISALLPTFYQRDYGLDIGLANNLTMIFPFAGLIAGIVAFFIMARTGKRKTLLWLGQALKVVGILLIFIGGPDFIGLVGVFLVGAGNCLWIPAMYVVPMDLEDMNPTRVGAAFAFITSGGYISGLIAPIIAGALSEVFNYGTAIVVCAFPCCIGLVACLMIRETGPGRAEK